MHLVNILLMIWIHTTWILLGYYSIQCLYLHSEVMEHRKEGYESDIAGSSDECSDSLSDSGSVYSVQSVASMRLHLRRSSHGSALVGNLSSDEDDDMPSAVTSSCSPLDVLTSPSLVSNKTLPDVRSRSPTGSSNRSITTDLTDVNKAVSIRLSHPSCSPHTPHLSPSPHPSHSPRHTRMLRMRHYFNEDHTYVMDAKRRGNLGRYINVGTV